MGAKILIQHARMWPREVFDFRDWRQRMKNDPGFKVLSSPGVYVLYRDDVPWYVGQTKNKLRNRVGSHATRPGTRYYNFWNYFSAFAVKDKGQRDQIEAILIAAMPTANSVEPKMRKQKFPKAAAEMLRRIRQGRASPSVSELR